MSRLYSGILDGKNVAVKRRDGVSHLLIIYRVQQRGMLLLATSIYLEVEGVTAEHVCRVGLTR